MDLGDFDAVKPVTITAVMISNVVVNSIVLAVIAKYPQLREDLTTLFVFSLSVSDLASGCTTMPISAAVCSDATPQVRHMRRYLPMIQAFCSTWFAFVSLHSLCWVAIFKMVAITKPLRYEQLLTRNRCYVIIVLIWLIGILFSASTSYVADSWDVATCFFHGPHPTENTEISVFMSVFVLFGWTLPVVIILYSNAMIFKAVRRAHTQINAQVKSISGGSVESSPSITIQTIRSGKNVLIISLTVLILTIPSASVITVIAVGKGRDLPKWYKFTGIWIFMCNYSANSFLYIFLFRSVRKKTKEMFYEFRQTCHLW